MKKSAKSLLSDQSLQEILPLLRQNAVTTDRNRVFVSENYRRLKKIGFFSAMIPPELGGLGITHQKMCHYLRIIGGCCGSTALALSMHQHLVAAQVWKYRQENATNGLLQKVADQELVLCGSGAVDWMTSSGTMQKVDGGFLVNALKRFASNAAGADLFITSATWKNENGGRRILHFGVPIQTEGLEMENNWDTLGMRGTGSNSIRLTDVFVPEKAIALDRPHGEYHPVWNLILTVAVPLIMSAYTGIAEEAANCARRMIAGRPISESQKDVVGQMNNQLTSAQVLLESSTRICNNFDVRPQLEHAHQMLTRKSLITAAVIKTVDLAMTLTGGAGYMTDNGLERCFRDVQAARYHPLPEKAQHIFSAEHLLAQKSAPVGVLE